nr:hypothetical protein [Tanacetum cinerariifolium]
MAFISSAKNSSDKEKVNTASIPTASTNVSPASANIGAASISQDTACTYIASQPNEENHTLVVDEEAPTEFALMAKTSTEVFDNSLCSKACKKNTDSLNSKTTDLTDKLSDSENMLYHYKLGLSQVEGRLVEFKNQEVKFCEKIRGLEFSVKCKTNRIQNLTKELETLKNEKEGLESKLTGFKSATRDLDHLIGSQRSDKIKEDLGYSVVPPLLLKSILFLKRICLRKDSLSLLMTQLLTILGLLLVYKVLQMISKTVALLLLGIENQLVASCTPSPNYIPGPEAPPSLDYILGPEYPEYLPAADDVLPAEEQPLPVAVSLTAESPGYITKSEPEMEPKEEDGDDEKSEDDFIEYPTSRGDDDVDDDGDDLSEDVADDEEEEESSVSKEEEDEHLASTVPAPALYSSVSAPEETEPFEKGETTATPPPFGYRVAARISVQPHILMPFRSESEVERLLAIPTPPLSPVLPTSYPLPPLLMPLPIFTPLPTSSFPLPSPTGGYEVGESSIAAATARQIRPALTIADRRRADDR